MERGGRGLPMHACERAQCQCPPPEHPFPPPCSPHSGQVVGLDADVASAKRRGLKAVQMAPLALTPGSLPGELAVQLFEAIVYWGPYGALAESEEGDGSLATSWWERSALRELARVLVPGGRLCVEADVADPGVVFQQLRAAGYKAEAWEDLGAPAAGRGMRVRLIAVEDSPDFV